MNTPERLHDSASGLVEAARAFQTAAEQPGSHLAASSSLESLEDALQAISAGWYRLAADAAPRVDGLSREQEVRLMGALHDVAAAFARCARACRAGRSSVKPIIARRMTARPAVDQGSGDGLWWFESREPPPRRAA
jgi:hypothetical protein